MTVPLSRRRAGARNGARLSELAIQQEKARQAAEAELHHAEIKALRATAKAAEDARVKFTADDLRDAVVVRDEFGWHKVVRVSAKSVTVATAYSWTERIAVDKVLEFRAAPSERVEA